jgi:hypothetical protein
MYSNLLNFYEPGYKAVGLIYFVKLDFSPVKSQWTKVHCHHIYCSYGTEYNDTF